VSSASKAASLFTSLGLLHSARRPLVLKPAHIPSQSPAGGDPAGASPSVPQHLEGFGISGDRDNCRCLAAASRPQQTPARSSAPGALGPREASGRAPAEGRRHPAMPVGSRWNIYVQGGNL